MDIKDIIKHHPTIIRYSGAERDTLGLLFLNGKFACYILENAFKLEKVMKETRIPEGVFPLELRKEGGFHARYSKSFPEMHEGMIWLRNVPDFEYILYHIGNSHVDTHGCLLPGDQANMNALGMGYVQQSRQAYLRTYPVLVDYIKTQQDPVMHIIDLDRLCTH